MTKYTAEQLAKIKSSAAKGRLAAIRGSGKPQIKQAQRKSRKMGTALKIKQQELKQKTTKAFNARIAENAARKAYIHSVGARKYANSQLNVTQQQEKIAKRKKRDANAAKTVQIGKQRGYKASKRVSRRAAVAKPVKFVKNVGRTTVKAITVPIKGTIRATGKLVNKTINFIDPAGYGKALGKNFNPFK